MVVVVWMVVALLASLWALSALSRLVWKEGPGHHENVPRAGHVWTGVPVPAWEYQIYEAVPRSSADLVLDVD